MALSQVQQLRGLALPAIRTAGGYFATKGPNDMAWGALINAVFTPLGSRPFRRQFGSTLHEVVMEPNDATTQSLVEYVIKDAVQRWAPSVIVQSVVTRPVDNKIGILIQFSRSDDRQRLLSSPAILISKSDIVNLLAASRNT